MSQFDTEWKGTHSEALLNDLWHAGDDFWKAIEKCIEHAKTLPKGFEKEVFLNSVSGHIESGIDKQQGGFTAFKELVDNMREKAKG